jgi:hypothetical protein
MTKVPEILGYKKFLMISNIPKLEIFGEFEKGAFECSITRRYIGGQAFEM